MTSYTGIQRSSTITISDLKFVNDAGVFCDFPIGRINLYLVQIGPEEFGLQPQYLVDGVHGAHLPSRVQ